jgi:hypothetical protein
MIIVKAKFIALKKFHTGAVELVLDAANHYGEVKLRAQSDEEKEFFNKVSELKKGETIDLILSLPGMGSKEFKEDFNILDDDLGGIFE